MHLIEDDQAREAPESVHLYDHDLVHPSSTPRN